MSIFKALIPYFGVMLITFLGAFMMLKNTPGTVDDVILKIDIIGISEAAKLERARNQMINSLNISSERKKILLNKTVFMGASTQMVYLALGLPNNWERIGKPSVQDAQSWVYFLPGDRRPTILEFEENVLMRAYKGSALDVVSVQDQHPSQNGNGQPFPPPPSIRP